MRTVCGIGLCAIIAAFACLGLSRGADQETPRKKILVRRDISSLAPNGPEIAAFRKAVQVMKARPANDPTSWAFQADIHTKYCQHGNYFFLPWHRMYGYWIERILRDASGDPEFAIPYWNYSTPNARALPEAFRVPADASNFLYIAQRNQDAGGINSGARLPAAATVSFWHPFRLTNFETTDPGLPSFGGLVVMKPKAHAMSTMGSFESYHNLMHVLLGGEGGYMSDLMKSSLDPLFFPHHHNVDRLWKRWLDQGGGRANPLDDSNWMDAEFPFWDEKGKEVRMKVRDALETEGQLSYRYDDDPPPMPQPRPVARPAHTPMKTLAATNAAPVQLGTDGPVRVTIDLGDEASTAANRKDGKLALRVEGIRFDTEPVVFYEVYVNLPPKETPDFQSVHYAGNLVFAGIMPDAMKAHAFVPPDGHKSPVEAFDHLRAFDITDIVRELQARKLWNDKQLTVTFVMNGLVPAGKEAITRPGPKARFDKIVLTGN